MSSPDSSSHGAGHGHESQDARAIELLGPVQPQLYALIQALLGIREPTFAAERFELAERFAMLLGTDADVCLARLRSGFGVAERQLLLKLATAAEEHSPEGETPTRRTLRLEGARRFRETAQLLALLEQLPS